MAWLKVEVHTPDKPEIFDIADQLGIDPDAVFGKCFRVWSWFDAHTTNGKTNGCGVSDSLIDRLTSVSGFAKAMHSAGWLESDGEIYTMPKFDEHNGESAKKRALTAKRVSKHTKKTNAKDNASSVSEALPREEKRREDKEKEQKNSNVTVADLVAQGVSFDSANELLAIRKKKRSALTQLAWKGISSEFNKAGISADEGIAIMSKRGWQSFEAQWIKKEIGNAHSKSRFDVIAETTAALTGRRNISERVIEGFAKQVG